MLLELLDVMGLWLVGYAGKHGFLLGSRFDFEAEGHLNSIRGPHGSGFRV